MATGKPVVVVLFEGRPRVLGDIPETATAVLQAYRPGSRGAEAVVDVLYGVHNPSGILPYSYPRYSGTVFGLVLAAGGYPDSYRKGDVIEGLPPVDAKDCKVFHAGTLSQHGRVVTSGGRVLCACALGETIAEARDRAYTCVDRISWPDMYYRKDIGHRAIGREG